MRTIEKNTIDKYKAFMDEFYLIHTGRRNGKTEELYGKFGVSRNTATAMNNIGIVKRVSRGKYSVYYGYPAERKTARKVIRASIDISKECVAKKYASENMVRYVPQKPDAPMQQTKKDSPKQIRDKKTPATYKRHRKIKVFGIPLWESFEM